jgi:hypothetical protein
MRQRIGESDEDYRERRSAYDASRAGRGKWRKIQRTRGKSGEIVSTVEKRRRPVESAVKIPAAVVSRTSTLYDAENQVVQQWVQEKPGERERLNLIRDAIIELARDQPKIAPTPPPVVRLNEDLCVGYGVGDQHMGMLAWKHETGASYDLEIGERLLTGAFEHLTETAPRAGTGLLILIGDFFHYDSMEPVTPTSRNLLDADGRYPKMIMAGMRTIRNAIKAALRVHNFLRVIVEPGNHDLASAQSLAIALSFMFENEPRVSVDISPRHFHYFVFGGCLLGTHHGHGVKLEKLPIIMATDQPEAWASCPHRYWITGHVHHKQIIDVEGVQCESLRILPPADAYAANKGYRSIRSMDATVYHRRHGEVARHRVNPQMLEN